MEETPKNKPNDWKEDLGEIRKNVHTKEIEEQEIKNAIMKGGLNVLERQSGKILKLSGALNDRTTQIHKEGVSRISPELKKLIRRENLTEKEITRIDELEGYLQNEIESLEIQIEKKDKQKERQKRLSKKRKTDTVSISNTTGSNGKTGGGVIKDEIFATKETASHSKKDNIEQEDPKKVDSVLNTIGIKSEEEEIKEIRNEIQETEVFRGLGISLKESKKIEGFETLSHGQRILVAGNLKQLALGRVHEEAREQYKEDTVNARFLGRIWQNISKKYQIAKLEKVTATDIVSGGMDMHEETLTHLIGRAGDGPEVEVAEDGSLRMLYVSNMENSTPEQIGDMESFNKIASEFSRAPEEWRYETASKKEQEEYKKLRKQYEKAKAGVLEIKSSEVGDQDATLYMNDIDTRVYSDQFLNTHPDVEKQLQNITDKNIWMRAMANVATERGIYSAAGFLTRSVTISLLGLAGIPLAAAGMGGFMARRRAKEALTEHEKGARMGTEDRSKEAKNFVNVDQMREKLEKLTQKVNLEEDPDKREKLSISLKARVSYTQGKMKDGLVNYGKGVNRLASQYELTSLLGAAAAEGEVSRAEDRDSELEKRLVSFLSFKEEKISETQKKYLRNKMTRGAVMGAGFSVSGYALRHFGEEWFGWGEKVGVGTVKVKQVSQSRVGLGNVVEQSQDSRIERIIERNRQKVLENMADSDRSFDRASDFAERMGVNGRIVELKEKGGVTSSFITEDGVKHIVPKNLFTEIEKKHISLLSSESIGVSMSNSHIQTPPISDSSNAIRESYGRILDSKLGIQDTMGTQDQIVENIRNLVSEIQETPEYIVQPGDNIWNIIENKLKAHDIFRGLNEGQRTHLIDELKDKVSAMSLEELKEFGVSSGDPNILNAGDQGDQLDFSKIMDAESVSGGVSHAENLTDAQISSIEANNIKISEWAQEHPGVELNEETVSKILSGSEVVDSQPESVVEQSAGIPDAVILEKAESLVAQEVEALYGSKGIFGSGFLSTPGERSVDWLDIKTKTVGEVMSKNIFPTEDIWGDEIESTGINSEKIVTKTQEYLRKLIDTTGGQPNSGENVEDYMKRVASVIVRKQEG